jgi:hypothetical protein
VRRSKAEEAMIGAMILDFMAGTEFQEGVRKCSDERAWWFMSRLEDGYYERERRIMK